jgi:prefoldin subunit 5
MTNLSSTVSTLQQEREDLIKTNEKLSKVQSENEIGQEMLQEELNSINALKKELHQMRETLSHEVCGRGQKKKR